MNAKIDQILIRNRFFSSEIAIFVRQNLDFVLGCICSSDEESGDTKNDKNASSSSTSPPISTSTRNKSPTKFKFESYCSPYPNLDAPTGFTNSNVNANDSNNINNNANVSNIMNNANVSNINNANINNVANANNMNNEANANNNNNNNLNSRGNIASRVDLLRNSLDAHNGSNKSGRPKQNRVRRNSFSSSDDGFASKSVGFVNMNDAHAFSHNHHSSSSNSNHDLNMNNNNRNSNDSSFLERRHSFDVNALHALQKFPFRCSISKNLKICHPKFIDQIFRLPCHHVLLVCQTFCCCALILSRVLNIYHF